MIGGTKVINYTAHGDVAILTMDDGKANALGHALIDQLNEVLDRAVEEAKAVVITGRPGLFCAGFDLKELDKGHDATMALVHKGARLLLRIFSHPQPVVAACTGHAIAAGAFILLAADTRLGVDGDFKIGLNETAIGLILPTFGLELAKARLSKRYQTAAVIQATMYDPLGAKNAGFLDDVVSADGLLSSAVERAASLAEFPSEAYAANKTAIRFETIANINASLGA